MRERRGFEGQMPSAGDKLVCLRNNRKKGLFNGGLWRVKSRTQPRGKSKILTMRLSPDEARTLRAKGFEFYDWGPGEARLVTSWDQDRADVDSLAAAIGML